MEQATSLLLLFAGLWIGGAVVWFVMTQKTQQASAGVGMADQAESAALVEKLRTREAQLEQLRAQLEELRAETERWRAEAWEARGLGAAEDERLARLPELERSVEERDRRIAALEAEIADFRAAQAAIAQSHVPAPATGPDGPQDLDHLVVPLQEALEKLDTRIGEIESARTNAFAGLTEQVQTVAARLLEMQKTTAGLATAFRTPGARSGWGEVQLRRVVEMAGMIEHCDFAAPESNDGFGPDLMVRLPGRRQIAVDARAPLGAIQEALETVDEPVRSEKLAEHARLVRGHVEYLGSKAYKERLQPAPEFVVAFLPGESFFAAALQQDQALIEFAAERQVVLATPTTLIALLKAIAYGWRHERVADSVQAFRDLGSTIYERLRQFGQHLRDLQGHLERTNVAFNRASAMLETGVFEPSRRLRELGAAAAEELEAPPMVDTMPRSIHALERAVDSEEELAPVAENA